MDHEDNQPGPAPSPPSSNETPADAPTRAHNGLPKPAFALGIVVIVAVLLVACFLLLKPSLGPKSGTDRQIDDALRE